MATDSRARAALEIRADDLSEAQTLDLLRLHLEGIGALRELGGGTGEVKSMRTHPDFLRRGVAAALLEHIIAEAKARKLARLSLETGSGEAFEPALALYRRRGFVEGAAFGDYVKSAFNQFLHMELG